jgi:hypothetical protein
MSQKWEYFCRPFDVRPDKAQDLEGFLDRWGSDGWEVVAVINLDPTGDSLLIAKRPVEGT